MPGLSKEKCVPCREGAALLADAQIEELKKEIPDWQVIEEAGIKRLRRVFKFNDFGQALAFTGKIGALAQTQDHHPAILTEWGKVTITLWTHKIGGLHRNDFVMAAKADKL